MDIFKILIRMLVNLVKDLPFTPRRLRVARWRQRRGATFRTSELERLDRLRNPTKYRPEPSTPD